MAEERSIRAAAGQPARLCTEEQLQEWGRRLGPAAVRAGVLVALIGELGAGKSTLVRAACRGLGVEEHVPSPTFTLVHRLRRADGGVVWHVDLYRIETTDRLEALGWEELTAAPDPVFVEWADRAGDALPADRWEVRLAIPENEGRRRVRWTALGRTPPMPVPEGDPC